MASFVVWVLDPQCSFGTGPESTTAIQGLVDGVVKIASGGKASADAYTGALISADAAKAVYKAFRYMEPTDENGFTWADIEKVNQDIGDELRVLNPDWLEEQGEWDD